VVGEEAVAADARVLDRLAGAQRAIVIDPIDGTWNFAHGLATFGVILSVIEDGATVFGLLYDPLGDDWMMAHRGGGAWFVRPGATPMPCHVSKPAPIAETSGMLPLHMFDRPVQQRLAAAIPEFGRIGGLRCSCHEYRLLAQGGFDFCLSASLNVWDHAAGVLIHAEAGGFAALIDGEPYSPLMRSGSLLVAPDKASWEAVRAQLGFAVPA
jgi:fructose-1,6-bisphosphatase/inositol monophosphatase family enzyme